MNPLNAWNRFWFSPISARPLGVYRIVFGLVVLAHYALVAIDVDFWYTDQGLLRADEASLVAGPYRPSILNTYQDPTTVRVALAASACIAAAFTAGWHTRTFAVLNWLGLLTFYNRNLLTNCGPDQLMIITAFYFMLAPSGAAFSLDARRAARRRGTEAEPLIYPWVQRLMQLQLCLIYFDTAFLKCGGRLWQNGTSIHYILFNHEVGQFHVEWLAGYPVLLNLMAYSALMVEFGMTVFLWFRPTRRWAALAGIGLHAGIWPIVNVPLFGEQMIAFYLLFLAPDELQALGSFLARPFRRVASHSDVQPLARPRGVRQLELAFTAHLEGA